MLYQHVTHGNGDCSNSITQWTGIQRFSRHIRSLAIATSYFPNMDLLGCECRFLTSLDIGPFSEDIYQPSQWCVGLLELIYCNPSIQTLRIQLHEDLGYPLFQEHQILRHLPALKHLAILRDTYPDSLCGESNGVFEALLESGHQLESLVYHVSSRGLEIMTHNDSMCSHMWTEVTSLEIRDSAGHRGMELMKRCPSLRRLKMDFAQGADNHEMLRQLVQNYDAGHTPSLEHLEILGMVSNNAQLALLMLIRLSAGAMQLKSFSISRSIINELLIEIVVACYVESLETLIIVNPDQESSYEISTPFTSCTRLKHLEVSVEDDKPWIESVLESPWVCTQLRILRITIRSASSTGSNSTSITATPATATPTTTTAVATTTATATTNASSTTTTTTTPTTEDSSSSPNMASQQRLFWKQLGLLHNLETLSIDMPQTDVAFCKSLSIVEEDLESLGSLDQLQELQIPKKEGFMTTALVKALKEKRPKLNISYSSHRHM
ncbi:hypothetical protein BGX34_003916 [Mortierella sp. NVP85]|nr:hypothetical protein BGX34_003916 [Mortierella sp. NVP85]